MYGCGSNLNTWGKPQVFVLFQDTNAILGIQFLSHSHISIFSIHQGAMLGIPFLSHNQTPAILTRSPSSVSGQALGRHHHRDHGLGGPRPSGADLLRRRIRASTDTTVDVRVSLCAGGRPHFLVGWFLETESHTQANLSRHFLADVTRLFSWGRV